MNVEIRMEIDRKIESLGEYGCRKFLEAADPAMAYAADYRKAVRSKLASEDWDELNRLFLDWK